MDKSIEMIIIDDEKRFFFYIWRRILFMCGIVGYIGIEDLKEILLCGFEKLEYCGYDLVGIVVVNNEGVYVFKEKGCIVELC